MMARSWTRAQCRRLFDLPGEETGAVSLPTGIKATLEDHDCPADAGVPGLHLDKEWEWFDTEMDKLDHWAEDRRASLKAELDELDEAIKETKKAARLAPNLPEKLERQRELRQLETKRDDAWKAFDEAAARSTGRRTRC